MKQSERVWKWSIEANDGRAWIFFIFDACRWLPTNHRCFYEDKSPFSREKCQLCLMSVKETTEHMWICPAFRTEREELYTAMTKMLMETGIPYANRKIPSQETSLCRYLAEAVD